MSWKDTISRQDTIDFHMKNGLTKKQAEHLADTVTYENQNGDAYSKKLLDKSLKNQGEISFELPNHEMTTENFFNKDKYSVDPSAPIPSDDYLKVIYRQRELNNAKKSNNNNLEIVKSPEPIIIDNPKTIAEENAGSVLRNNKLIRPENGPIGATTIPALYEMLLPFAMEKAIRIEGTGVMQDHNGNTISDDDPSAWMKAEELRRAMQK